MESLDDVLPSVHFTTVTPMTVWKGVDVFFARGATVELACGSVSSVTGIPRRNFWDGETDDIGDLLSTSTGEGWCVYWRTKFPEFPIKLDVNLSRMDDLVPTLTRVRELAGHDLAVPDDGSPNPFQYVLFSGDGTTRTVFLPAGSHGADDRIDPPASRGSDR